MWIFECQHGKEECIGNIIEVTISFSFTLIYFTSKKQYKKANNE
jgi:hypothetical protein